MFPSPHHPFWPDPITGGHDFNYYLRTCFSFHFLLFEIDPVVLLKMENFYGRQTDCEQKSLLEKFYKKLLKLNFKSNWNRNLLSMFFKV